MALNILEGHRHKSRRSGDWSGGEVDCELENLILSVYDVSCVQRSDHYRYVGRLNKFELNQDVSDFPLVLGV